MDLTRRTLRKVPAITLYFWIVKLLTTAMGEATSDYAVHTISPEVAVVLGGLALAGALAWQLSLDRYVAPGYWLAVVMVAVTGTMGADVLHIGLGVPYAASTTAFAVVLAAIFVIWYRTEGTLSIHGIVTLRRELYYWATILATFALGTAAGDLTAYTLHLGFLASGIVFAAVMALAAAASAVPRVDRVVIFWFAYIITRPLGASFADWMGVPRNLGGLDWGRGTVSAAFSVLIVAFVAYLTATRLDVEGGRAAPAAVA